MHTTNGCTRHPELCVPDWGYTNCDGRHECCVTNVNESVRKLIDLGLSVGGSAVTPASAARNCAVDRRIAEPIGVTDVRVQ